MTPVASGPPQQIYIIRHGEKPADLSARTPGRSPSPPGPPFGIDFDGKQSIHSLLPRGWQRSGALTVLFDPATGLLQGGLLTPASLFSPSYGDPTKTQQHRTYQTIQGLSSRLTLQINTPVPEGQEATLISSILASYSGIVLICWEHHHIPSLATAIPTAPATTIPAVWPNDRFDVVWSFTSTPGTQIVEYSFSQIPQQLLAGDTDTTI